MGMKRRDFIWGTTFGLAAGVTPRLLGADETARVVLPFENGERPLVAYPQKRPLIRLTARPPQLETPFAVFNEGVVTPNDAFFVRYHLGDAPPARSGLEPEHFRLTVKGHVEKMIELSVSELQSAFEPVEVMAVNQCSGNSRGFFQPRVPGGQLGHGAMGCAKWRGVKLADVLRRAGLKAGAKQVLLNGLDAPSTAGVPDFVKALELDQALDSEVLLAWEMNGEPLPWLNGYPLRLVMPGYYGTYWLKHLHEITVVDEAFKGFWMDPAYRIPDDPCAHVAPGTTPKHTVPITRFNVRSFLTSLAAGTEVPVGTAIRLRGIAFDGGSGIREVVVSDDAGRTWRAAELGRDGGKYAFREWTLPWKPVEKGPRTLLVRATNALGQSQPLEPLWNPAGYMRNVVEQVACRII